MCGRPAVRVSTRSSRGWSTTRADVQRDSSGWPLVGFILMIDAFRPDNGATRFVLGSHFRFQISRKRCRRGGVRAMSVNES
jgi:ectoine hydroxylase-related dioxygenase (phytanoyl-CoA dioxygenase family)